MNSGEDQAAASGIARAVHVAARPGRANRGRAGLVIQPYRGYGKSDEVFLMGRVFKQPGFGSEDRSPSFKRDLADIGRRIFRRGVRDARIVARLGGQETTVSTDDDGYFRIRMKFDQPLDDSREWHRMKLDFEGRKGRTADTEADVYVPPAVSSRVVISDIDDTVMWTGVANRIAMVWRLFTKRAESRTAFPGVGALYRALHEGPGDGRSQGNAMLYVSRGPWSIFEVLDEFFHLHGIPVGPVLFLREWGITIQSPLPRRAEGHKKALIDHMLEFYDDRSFVLIGDSGQHDPEIYADIVRRHPGRVEAVYIRNVSGQGDRTEGVADLAHQLEGEGAGLILADDSFVMAEHAAKHGLISEAGLQAVLEERDAEKRKAEAA